MITYRDLTIFCLAGLAVAVCFASIASLLGNLGQVSFAQEDIVVQNGTAVVPVQTAADALLAQVQATMTGIMGLLTTAGTIVAIVIGWIRSKTGDKIISKDVNVRFQTALGQIEQKDNELRDVFRQVLEQREKINAFVDVAKAANPEIAKQYDEYVPKITTKLSEIQRQVDVWQNQADKFYQSAREKQ